MDKKIMLGHKIRRFRQDQGLSQTQMAEQLGISPSYLNLIEHNQRPVTVPLLFRLGQAFDIDLREFAEDEEAQLVAGLSEVFGDPLFEGQAPRQHDIRDLAAASPPAAQAVLTLYEAYRKLWEDTQALTHRMVDRDKFQANDGAAFPAEEVREFQQAESNHFADLETAAEQLWEDAGLEPNDVYRGLVEHLDKVLSIRVKVMPIDVMQDTLRRYDHHGRRVLLSEALPPSGRSFQLATQLALMSHREALDRVVERAGLQGEDARSLLRVGLASYFAGAVMMPYERFLAAARDLAYDIDLLQHRFDASFEQVCHRLTTLQRPGARGVRFFFIRVDNAGNVSKRLSGGGFHFARFGGTCPRWIIHDAFRAPGVIQTQVAEMPDATMFFTIARTLDPLGGWQRALQPQFAIGLGCDLKDAAHLVYAEGINLKKPNPITPIGVSCRVCERLDCAQRAHPPLNHRLRIEEHVRRTTPFAYAN